MLDNANKFDTIKHAECLLMNTLFIHTNRKQLFGAKLGKYSFERGAGGKEGKTKNRDVFL